MSSSATRFLMLLTTTTPTSSPFRYPSLLGLTRHRSQIPSFFSSFSHRYHNLFSSSLPHPLRIESSPSYHHQVHTSALVSDSPSTSPFPSTSGFSHPWPEWSNFVNSLSAAEYFKIKNGFGSPVDEFTSVDHLPEEFLRSCTASLAFALDKPEALGMLSRRDVEVVVQNGLPFLFKNSDDSVRRMERFLHGGDRNVPDADRSHTVDLMKFLLSYASRLVSSETTSLQNIELVESSVRTLLSELTQLACNAVEANLSGSLQNQFPDRYGTSRPRGQNIEMKKGDWICSRCSFMNFARNVKCLECEEARPKRQLTGGEWECPQCDFYNYARNMVCLRCDCKRPGEVSPVIYSSRSDSGYGNGSYTNKSDVDRKLAAKEEKAQRWSSKDSQMDGILDGNSAMADGDFPEIMPLRKGVNRFVVSTRKSPLERRLANAQFQKNMDSDGTCGGNAIQNTGANNAFDQTISRSPASISTSGSPKYGAPMGSTSNHVPFVPLPSDMFAKKPENLKMEESEKVNMDNRESLTSRKGEQTSFISESNVSGESRDSSHPSEMSADQTPSADKEKEEAEKSERWFKRVAELHNVTDLNAISDDDFPEIMPMRKGENRFVVSKRKDRSLTSPLYKRRMALEQANNSNSVPFVPFPPNYFAKKDNQQPKDVDFHDKGLDKTSSSANLEKPPEKLDDAKPEMINVRMQALKNQLDGTGSLNSRPAGENRHNLKKDAFYGEPASGDSTLNFVSPQPASRESCISGNSMNANGSGTSNSKECESGGYSLKEEKKNLTGSATQPSENQNARNSWTGKSLEGSLVKEPDPLDMSEEAKAERWFRRVAQIKDISELSQIPDEDFPSIMPMRKGVNRFVVSKRKTPLERRLTSSQYRKNLPITSSDPVKENDSS